MPERMTSLRYAPEFRLSATTPGTKRLKMNSPKMRKEGMSGKASREML